jgi:hypothetical protein
MVDHELFVGLQYEQACNKTLYSQFSMAGNTQIEDRSCDDILLMTSPNSIAKLSSSGESIIVLDISSVELVDSKSTVVQISQTLLVLFQNANLSLWKLSVPNRATKVSDFTAVAKIFHVTSHDGRYITVTTHKQQLIVRYVH